MKKSKFALVIMLAFTLFSFLPKTNETYQVDTKKSTVKWTGYHLAKSYEHWGNIGIKSGTIEMEGDEITGGKIVMDMTTITNGDLEGEKNGKLVADLKSERFFAVDKFSEASLTIKSASKDGDIYTITADIEIRGIAKEINFEATKTNATTFASSFTVDRTLHDVMYGWTVENAILDNDFKLDVELVLER